MPRLSVSRLKRGAARIARDRIASSISKGNTEGERSRREQIINNRVGDINNADLPSLLAIPQKLQSLNKERIPLQSKRKAMRLKGQRSTRRSRTTPDIFASSLGATKTLLGQ